MKVNLKKLNKDKLLLQKKKYLFLIIIMFLGLIAGITFLFFISKEDKQLLIESMNNFFISIKEHKLDYINGLINSITSNCLYISIIWILGISIVGIPLILFLLFFKSFVLGFSITSIIANYGFKGVFLAFSYIFPHQLLFMLIRLLLGFYSISFSNKLFKVLFLKKNINLKEYFNKYLKILGICLIASIISSLIEIYITPNFINLFIF